MRRIVLNFKGVEYVISENRAFEAGAEVEEIVTFAEMNSWGDKPRFFKLAMALGALLRFAGAKVSDAEVKREIDTSLLAVGGGDEARGEYLMGAIGQLQAILFDGAPEDDAGEAPGKAKASSKSRSKRRSKNSG